jgi:hypothetical protein
MSLEPGNDAVEHLGNLGERVAQSFMLASVNIAEILCEAAPQQRFIEGPLRFSNSGCSGSLMTPDT